MYTCHLIINQIEEANMYTIVLKNLILKSLWWVQGSFERVRAKRVAWILRLGLRDGDISTSEISTNRRLSRTPGGVTWLNRSWKINGNKEVLLTKSTQAPNIYGRRRTARRAHLDDYGSRVAGTECYKAGSKCRRKKRSTGRRIPRWGRTMTKTNMFQSDQGLSQRHQLSRSV